MMTMRTSALTDTVHMLNRDGTAALCRVNLTPYTFTEYHGVPAQAVYQLDGRDLQRSSSFRRPNCLACARKLAKLLAEAHDLVPAEELDYQRRRHENNPATPQTYDEITTALTEHAAALDAKLPQVVINTHQELAEHLEKTGIRWSAAGGMYTAWNTPAVVTIDLPTSQLGGQHIGGAIVACTSTDGQPRTLGLGGFSAPTLGAFFSLARAAIDLAGLLPDHVTA